MGKGNINRPTGFLAQAIVGILLSLVLLAVTAGSGGPKTYWHFTFKALIDKNNINAAEWAWVTMVEYPAERAYAAEAQTAERFGGALTGTVFAHVRSAAWRSQHRYTVKKRCRDRPAEMEVFWEESWSESVFPHGQLVKPYRQTSRRTGERYWVHNEMMFGLTTRRILREDGRWEDLQARAHVFLGAVNIAGSPHEETRGDFSLQCVNYRDPLVHYRFCGKAWVEQYDTGFRTLEINNLRVRMEEGESEYFSQRGFGPRDEKNLVYEIVRTTSREHPHWKRQEM